MHQVFTSWSGGKDSCFACYQATDNGHQVRYLLNMITEDGQRSWTHGLSAELLQMQAQAMGIPLVQKRTTMADYEVDFKKTLLTLKQKGISGGVFGDIDIEEHRQWVERVCREVAVMPCLPLWGQSQDAILRGFISSGFEAIVVAAKADLFGEEWLGRRLDRGFLEQLEKLRETKEITPCGEAGEYHTFVVDGPLFGKRIEILEADKVLREEYWFLDIRKCDLRPE